jgi:hypothetical protein
MLKLPTVASFWAGGPLSWIEQLSITSFLAAGHRYILYAPGPVTNPPSGVDLRPASLIFSPAWPIEDRRSAVFFSDLFRAELLYKTNFIWADLNVVATRPLNPVNGHLYGMIKPHRVGSSVLGLPNDSNTLRLLRRFLSSPQPVPEWSPDREIWKERAEIGDRWSILDLTWGDAGPRALTYFLEATGEIKNALTQPALYPIGQGALHWLYVSGVPKHVIETPATHAVHVFGYTRGLIAKHHSGLPPAGGWLHMQCKRHGIDPENAPIPDEMRQI